MPARLSVNLNAIAMLRNRRELPWPDVVGFGRIALTAGAAGLTVHPRPDERHVRFTDVPALKALITSEFPGREFNIEGYPSEDFLRLCEKHLPDQVTLVPDDPSQATSDHGWDFKAERDRLIEVCGRLKQAGLRLPRVPALTGSNCTPVPMAVATRIPPRRQASSKFSARPQTARWHLVWTSMPATT